MAKLTPAGRNYSNRRDYQQQAKTTRPPRRVEYYFLLYLDLKAAQMSALRLTSRLDPSALGRRRLHSTGQRKLRGQRCRKAAWDHAGRDGK